MRPHAIDSVRSNTPIVPPETAFMRAETKAETKAERSQPAARRRSVEQEQARDRKREEILRVAEDLFFRQGYAGTTLDGIASALGVTKPYVYYYFRSKEDIFETLCWQASVACLTAMHVEPGDTRSPEERIREGLRRFVSANITYFKAGTFAYRERGVLRPEFYRKLRTLARRFYREFCALLDEGRAAGVLEFDDTKLTALAVGSVAGFMYTWYKPDGPIGPEEMADQLLRIMQRIIGMQASAAKGRPRKRVAAQGPAGKKAG